MTDFEKIKDELRQLYKLRGYQDSTIELYTSWLLGLFKYYPTSEPTEISLAEIHTYIKILVNRKLSYSGVNQFFQAADFFYNRIHRKEYSFDKRLLPKRISKPFDILTQEQAFLIIDSEPNKKHKCIISLLYSCGLDASEIINLKPSDIKSKSSPAKLSVYDKNGQLVRMAVLSEKVLALLREYYKEYKPKGWLFEGQQPDTPYSLTSVRNVVNHAFERVGIEMDAEIRVLRISYIKHLVDLGVPLIVVMKHLDIKSYESVERYTKLIHGERNVDFSPYDKIVRRSGIQELDINNLEKLVFQLKNSDEVDYLVEALTCFRSDALRAGIVFSWTAFTRFIQNQCINKGFDQFNTSLRKLNPSAKQIKRLEDFETIKDLTLLTIAQDLGVISKHQKIQLESNLDLRNHCGHPSTYVPDVHKAKAFIEDIVNLMRTK